MLPVIIDNLAGKIGVGVLFKDPFKKIVLTPQVSTRSLTVMRSMGLMTIIFFSASASAFFVDVAILFLLRPSNAYPNMF